jgi:hypothetical protein
MVVIPQTRRSLHGVADIPPSSYAILMSFQPSRLALDERFAGSRWGSQELC